MARSLLVAALLLILPTAGHAAGVVTDRSGSPGADHGGFMSRGQFLAAAAGVNLATSAAFAYEKISGQDSLALDAMSMVISVPAVAYSTAYWVNRPGDVLMAGATIWGATLLVRNVIRVINNSRPSEEERGIIWGVPLETGTVGGSLSFKF